MIHAPRVVTHYGEITNTLEKVRYYLIILSFRSDLYQILLFDKAGVSKTAAIIITDSPDVSLRMTAPGKCDSRYVVSVK